MKLSPRLVGRRPQRPPGAAIFVVVATSALLLDAGTAIAAAPSAGLACPPVLAVEVLADKHPGWSIYSNDPLRLTGADIAFITDEDSTLDPDETRQLDDRHLSVVDLFHLRRHPELKNPRLVCHYGVHAELSRALPRAMTECTVTRHRQFDALTDSEVEAACR